LAGVQAKISECCPRRIWNVNKRISGDVIWLKI
jgi:hypothetical protein